MMNTKSEGLLDRLQVLTGTEYLSDLRFMDYECIRTHLPELEVESYTLAQWLDAAKYLTNATPESGTVQGVYEYLLAFEKQENVTQ